VDVCVCLVFSEEVQCGTTCWRSTNTVHLWAARIHCQWGEVVFIYARVI